MKERLKLFALVLAWAAAWPWVGAVPAATDRVTSSSTAVPQYPVWRKTPVVTPSIIYTPKSKGSGRHRHKTRVLMSATGMAAPSATPVIAPAPTATFVGR